MKPGGSPETQQAQTQTSQSPSGSGEAAVLLTQSSLQQHNLSSTTGLEQTGPGQATDSESGALGANAIRQIVSNAQLLVNNNNASISIQLKPEYLGNLKLVVDVEQGIVNAHFIAQNQATASLIQSRLPELKQALNNQGISWQRLNVSSGGQGNQQGASSQSQQQDTGQVEAPYDYGYTDNADSEAPLMTPAIYQWTGAGAFNYVV
jgi:flagellar hook-length control protein FliK